MRGISIIIPMYNCENYIENTILSIVKQKYKNIQIIIIDDGSTDNSYKICKEFSSKYKSIELYRQSNKGPGAARNLGLKYAKGEYITFVDADDKLPDNIIKNILKIVKKQSPDILIGNIVCFNDVRRWHLKYMNDVFRGEINKLSNIYVKEKIHLTSSVCNKWFKKSLIINNNICFSEEILVGEDLLFVEECYLKTNNIFIYNKDIYEYRAINRESLIRSYKIQFFYDLYILQKKLLDLYKDNNVKFPKVLLVKQIKFYIDSVFIKYNKLSINEIYKIIEVGKKIINLTPEELSEYLVYEDERKIIFYKLLLNSNIDEIVKFAQKYIGGLKKYKIKYVNNKYFHYLIEDYPQYKNLLEIKPTIECRVEQINIVKDEIRLRGYFLIKGIAQKYSENVQKKLIIKNNNNAKVSICNLKNQIRTDITYLHNKDNINYDWCGFEEISIDINEYFKMQGEYNIFIECSVNNFVFTKMIEISLAEIRNRLKIKQNKNTIISFNYIKNKYLVVNVKEVIKIEKIIIKIKLFFKNVKYDLKLLKLGKIKSFIVIIIYKILGNYIRKKNIWIMGERFDTAQDNTYFLFKYIKDNYPNINAKYVISKKSNDYKRIKKNIGIINFGSIRHSLYMLCASKVINSYTIRANMETKELRDIIKYYPEWYSSKKIFLQHGVIGFSRVNHSLHKNKVNYDLFITSFKEEKEHILNEYGYLDDEVILTGLARWDTLNNKNIQNKILIMPTWRSWITSEEELLNSEYWKEWTNLLCNKKFVELVNKNEYEVSIYLHYQMQKLLKKVNLVLDKKIKVIYKENSIVQELINTHKILITDYSTVSYDFNYLNRQIIFYQFDYDSFFDKHYNEGYLNKKQKLFGKRCFNEQEVICNLDDMLKKNIISYNKGDGNHREVILNHIRGM